MLPERRAPTGFLLLHPSVPRLALYLRMARPAVERDLRVKGMRLPDDVVQLWDELDRLASLAEPPEGRCGTSGTPRLPTEAEPQILPTVSTAAAAQLLGVSPRAVRGRLERGTLAGRLVGGTWQVDAAALAELARRIGGAA